MKILRNNDNEYIIKLHNQIIGQFHIDTEHTIWNFEIVSQMRRKGYGYQALCMIIEKFYPKTKKLQLFVKTTNIVAISLYTKCNFIIDINYEGRETLKMKFNG